MSAKCCYAVILAIENAFMAPTTDLWLEHIARARHVKIAAAWHLNYNN